MTPAELMQQTLPGFRWTGGNRFIAKCTGHEDGWPSLSGKVTDNGSVLLHCFAGCSIESIVSGAGIRVVDLFPSRVVETDQRGRWKQRRQMIASSLAPLVIRFQADLLVTHILLSDIGDAKPITDVDRLAAKAAASRVWAALLEAQHVV